MEGEPAAVILKFAFLGVLYLFLLLVARSTLKDMRGSTASALAGDGTGMHEIGSTRVAATDAILIALSGAGFAPGEQVDLFGGITIGRSAEADLRIEDRFASGLHCRVDNRGNTYYVEDLGSTNGTYLNGERLQGSEDLADLDEVSIGDTKFRFELTLPEAG